MPGNPVLRRIAASVVIFLAPALAVLEWLRSGTETPFVLVCVTLALPLCALLLHLRRLEPQLLVRAILWSNLVWLTMLCLIRAPPDAISTEILGWASGVGLGLLFLGADGLHAPSHRGGFAPVALRGTLVAIMVLALADMFGLGFWSGVMLEERDLRIAVVFLSLSAAVMGIATYGVYRLQTWGFLLNIAANIAIAAGAWLVPEMPNEFAACLTATAVAQLLAGLPLLWGMIHPRPGASNNPQRTGWLGVTMVAGLLGTVWWIVLTDV